MAIQVTALTKAKALELAAQDIVGGTIVDDNLVLIRRNGTELIAGDVRGQQGFPGNPGIGIIPTGIIMMYGSSSVLPDGGFLFCDGTAVSRTLYSELFAIIGNTYGAGDGSTTFNLPNMSNRFPRGNLPGASGGSDTHGHATTQPAHLHTFTGTAHTHTTPSHAHSLSSSGQAQVSIVATAPAIKMNRVTAASWNAVVESNAPAATASSTTGLTTGAALTGVTDPGGSGTSGSTTAGGSVGLTTPSNGATDVQSNVPIYTGVQFIIKI